MVSVMSAPENRVPEIQRHDGDHRNEGVAERVDDDDAPFAQSLGARRADVVLAQGLDHGGAHVAGVTADAGDGQAGHRQDEEARRVPEARRAHGAHAAGGQHAEDDGEDHDQQQRQPEGGHGDAGEGQQVDGVIGLRIGPPRRRDARRQSDGEGQEEAGSEQDEGVAERRPQHHQHRLGVQARVAKVAGQRRAEPVDVALEDGPVEAVEAGAGGPRRRT